MNPILSPALSRSKGPPKEPVLSFSKGPGEARLVHAIRKRKPNTRQDDPQPYDTDWGWWINTRLARVEAKLKWILGLALTTLAAEIVRIVLATANLE